MIRYILKRVVAALITIWFIMTLTFVLMYAIPGSPISTEKVYDVALQQALEEKFGLNKPLHERYVKCLVDYAHGDFGISYLKIGLTTNEIIASGFPYSLRIGIYATGLIVLFGIAAGAAALVFHLAGIESFGVSYLTPFAANAGEQVEGHAVLRRPLKRTKLRPAALRTRNRRNQR